MPQPSAPLPVTRATLTGPYADAIPLQWLDEQRVLLHTDERLIRARVGDGAWVIEQERTFAAAAGKQHHMSAECVSPVSAVMATREEERRGESVIGSFRGYVVVPDLEQLDRSVEQREYGGWLGAPDACPVPPDAAPTRAPIGDAQGAMPGGVDVVHHDHALGLRIAVERSGSFDAEPSAWSATVRYHTPQAAIAYEVARDEARAQANAADPAGAAPTATVPPPPEARPAVALPAGPWVYPHTFFKTLSCFSCGCSCDEAFEVHSAAGRVFAAVSGQAVDDEHEGLYVFLPEQRAWQPLVTGGELGGVAIAPSGCQALVRLGSALTHVQLCTPEAAAVGASGGAAHPSDPRPSEPARAHDARR